MLIQVWLSLLLLLLKLVMLLVVVLLVVELCVRVATCLVQINLGLLILR